MCNKAHLAKRFYLLLHNTPPLPPRVIQVYKQTQFGEAVAAVTKETAKELQKRPSEIPKIDLVPVDIPVGLWIP
jgi:hypothetical protein